MVSFNEIGDFYFDLEAELKNVQKVRINFHSVDYKGFKSKFWGEHLNTIVF